LADQPSEALIMALQPWIATIQGLILGETAAMSCKLPSFRHNSGSAQTEKSA
jgi:hypothetical protein